MLLVYRSDHHSSPRQQRYNSGYSVHLLIVFISGTTVFFSRNCMHFNNIRIVLVRGHAHTLAVPAFHSPLPWGPDACLWLPRLSPRWSEVNPHPFVSGRQPLPRPELAKKPLPRPSSLPAWPRWRTCGQLAAHHLSFVQFYFINTSAAAFKRSLSVSWPRLHSTNRRRCT